MKKKGTLTLEQIKKLYDNSLKIREEKLFEPTIKRMGYKNFKELYKESVDES